VQPQACVQEAAVGAVVEAAVGEDPVAVEAISPVPAPTPELRSMKVQWVMEKQMQSAVLELPGDETAYQKLAEVTLIAAEEQVWMFAGKEIASLREVTVGGTLTVITAELKKIVAARLAVNAAALLADEVAARLADNDAARLADEVATRATKRSRISPEPQASKPKYPSSSTRRWYHGAKAITCKER
jgi:hypothetical protein